MISGSVLTCYVFYYRPRVSLKYFLLNSKRSKLFKNDFRIFAAERQPQSLRQVRARRPHESLRRLLVGEGGHDIDEVIAIR